MRQSVRGRVAVVTGASNELGRATALALARRGAHLVLAPARGTTLGELAGACRRFGVQTLVVPTDVSDEAQVAALAHRAIEAFGQFDIWVNNAVDSFSASFERTSGDDFRRVLEANFVSYVHGAHAALYCFHLQGGGVLINVGCLDALLPQPYLGALVASRHAVRGLMQSLRQELFLRGDKGIHVCSVVSSVLAEPFATGDTQARASSRARQVARAIVRVAERPRREVFVGFGGRAMSLLAALVPGAVERSLARTSIAPRWRRARPTPLLDAAARRRLVRALGVSAALATPVLAWGIVRLPVRLAQA